MEPIYSKFVLIAIGTTEETGKTDKTKLCKFVELNSKGQLKLHDDTFYLGSNSKDEQIKRKIHEFGINKSNTQLLYRHEDDNHWEDLWGYWDFKNKEFVCLLNIKDDLNELLMREFVE